MNEPRPNDTFRGAVRRLLDREGEDRRNSAGRRKLDQVISGLRLAKELVLLFKDVVITLLAILLALKGADVTGIISG